MVTEQEIGELWRKPENYMKPLAFAAALLTAERDAVDKHIEALKMKPINKHTEDACAAYNAGLQDARFVLQAL